MDGAIFVAMSGAIGVMGTAIGILWRRDVQLSDRLIEFQRTTAAETLRALILSEATQNASNKALEAAADAMARMARPEPGEQGRTGRR